MLTAFTSACPLKLSKIQDLISPIQFKKISQVKKIILQALLDEEWVSSHDLLEKTQQKYFDRRIRELRAIYGLCIEFRKEGADYLYRWDLNKRTAIYIRTTIKAKDRKKLFAQSGPQCGVCKVTFQIDQLVADHRIPVSRNGNNDLENFQLVCKACNNQKRAQCKGCAFDCFVCPLAFPDRYEKVYIIGVKKLS